VVVIELSEQTIINQLTERLMRKYPAVPPTPSPRSFGASMLASMDDRLGITCLCWSSDVRAASWLRSPHSGICPPPRTEASV